MATSLLALLDDIATVLDDVAVLSKVAAKKTAGVLGDDLALNAEQVAGVRAHRELPVILAVAKGSLLNKMILVPAALIISALMPSAINLLLMAGGAFLCFEGFEKLMHRFLHDKAEMRTAHQQKIQLMASDPDLDLVAMEKKKIRGAIRTDFILSAEIIVITLGTVQAAAFSTQVIVLFALAFLFTIGIYGLVACIVRMDDLGLHLLENNPADSLRHGIGRWILRFAPRLMKSLSVIGTAAMFLVGGGILAHNMPWVHHLSANLSQAAIGWPGAGTLVSTFVPHLTGAVVGIFAGAIILGTVRMAAGIGRTIKPE